MNKCIHCEKVINNAGSLKAHELCCHNNPHRIKHNRAKNAGQKKGCIPWNKDKKFTEQTIENLITVIESGNYKQYNETTIRKYVRKYLIHKHGHKCMMCGLSEWIGNEIPLVCDHIDGNPANNELNNFRVICNNCDSILPTFKGKNKGRGRTNRYKTVGEKNAKN
jgi:hypothetical protein